MAIDFPDAPSNGDTHTVGDKTWTWDGTTWTLVTAASGDHGNLAGLSDDDHTQYLRVDGTRSADSLTVSDDFTVDTDTLHVDSTNDRVGIGTTSPSKKLHVKGDNEGIRIEDGGAADHYDIYRNDTTGFLEFTGSQTSFSGYDFEVNNGSNVMRITNSGNVGIGDTTPSYKLDVNGDINTTGDLRIAGTAVGEVTSFTPSVSNLTVGNGTWQWAYYAVVNELLFVTARFDFGSTSSLSGVFRIDAPGGFTLIENNISSGFAVLNDRSLGDFYPATLQPDNGGNQFRVVKQDYVSGWSRNEVDATTPFTWASQDRIWLSCWAAIA